MGKNPQAAIKRQQKTAAKAKARLKQNKILKGVQQANEHAKTAAKANWPPESIFPQAEHLYWVQHGVNYIVSDAQEGVWKPLFPKLYEGDVLAPEAIAQTILALPDGPDMHEAVAWSAQPRIVVYTFRQRCIARARTVSGKGPTNEDLLEKIKKPHDPSVWMVFSELKAKLREKREARNEAPSEDV